MLSYTLSTVDIMPDYLTMECTACGGAAEPLGALSDRLWWRCDACGEEYMADTPEESEGLAC